MTPSYLLIFQLYIHMIVSYEWCVSTMKMMNHIDSCE
nr:MAG TPA: hypothetical protein [Caudoviricetes sp.]